MDVIALVGAFVIGVITGGFWQRQSWQGMITETMERKGVRC